MRTIPENALRIIDNVVRTDEGGWRYSNHPMDTGGPTFGGVTFKAFHEWSLRPNNETITWKTFELLAQKQDKQLIVMCYSFYYEEYFTKIVHDPALPQHAQAMLFSCIINVGAVQAVKILQRTLNKIMIMQPPQLDVDGVLGSMTIKHFDGLLHGMTVENFDKFCQTFVYEWQLFYIMLVQCKPIKRAIFLRGWYKRAERYRIAEL